MLTATTRSVWWRKDPLNENNELLLDKLFRAHTESAFRDNVSSIAIANAAFGSGDLAKAIATGLLTLGGRHAPLEQTYYFLSLGEPHKNVGDIIQFGTKVPGWGGTFQKDKPDPIWEPVNHVLEEYYPEVHRKIVLVTRELHDHGKFIFPNPSAYTAAAAIIVGLTAKMAAYLFIASRLDAWAKIIANYIEGGVPISVS